jgi:hypothetical protein
VDRTELRQIPLTALFAALGVALPPVFHIFGLGSTFLPMFLPVMLGSMLLSWKFALVLAIFTPLSSWLLTGMPPIVPPFLPLIISELIIVALIVSILHLHWQWSVWLTLVIAIIMDRLFLFIMVTLVAGWLKLDTTIFSVAMVLSGLPGIILQLLVIPLTLKLIKQKFPTLARG